METPDDLPREGRLLEQAREKLRNVPQNEAARRAKMSGTRWRQIVERDAPSMRSPRGVARLVAMSRVVMVTPDQWTEIGRSDVAEKLAADGQPELPTDPRELAEHIEKRLAEESERQDAKMVRITEALRSVLGDAKTEELLETLDEPLADEPDKPGDSGRRRRAAS